MNFLIKTSLRNIKNNKFYASILFLFSATGSTIFLSTNNLKDNIEKSTHKFNSSENNTQSDFTIKTVSDNILGSSSAENSIPIQINFQKNIENLEFKSDYSTKFEITSNKARHLPEFNLEYKSSNVYDKLFEVQSNKEVTYSFPQTNNSASNYFSNIKMINCNGVDIMSSRIIDLVDKNTSKFSLIKEGENKNNIIFDDENAPILTKCPNQTNFLQTKIKVYRIFFHDIKKHLNNQQTNDSDVFGEIRRYFTKRGARRWELDQQKTVEVTNNNYQQTFYNRIALYEKGTNTANDPSKLKIYFFPVLRKDNNLNVSLNLSLNVNNKKDIKDKWKSKIDKVKNSYIFFKLNEEQKNNLLNYSEKWDNYFSDLKLNYFLGNIENIFNNSLKLQNHFLPQFQSVSYKQQIFLLHKLIFHNFLKETRNTNKNLEKFLNPKNSNGELDFQTIKTKLLELINEMKGDTLDDTKLQVHLTKLPKPNAEKTPSVDDFLGELDKPEKQEYLFLNIPTINKKISELSQYEQTKTPDKNQTKIFKYTNSSTDGGINISHTPTNNTNKKLSEVILETWEKWIKNEYYDENVIKNSNDSSNNNSSPIVLNDSNKQLITSYNHALHFEDTVEETLKKDQNKKTQTSQKTYDKKFLSLFPTKFETVYKSITEEVIKDVQNYIETKTENKKKTIQTFINDNNLLNLSFLIQTFENVNSNIVKASILESRKEKEEFSMNSHQSAVIKNIGNISAKINDPTKLNHSFKIINQDTYEKDINKLKIIEGNPLISSPENFTHIFNNFKKYALEEYPLYKYAQVAKILSNAKWSDNQWNEFFKQWWKYFDEKSEEPWKKGHFFSLQEWQFMVTFMQKIIDNDFNNLGHRIQLKFPISNNFYPFENIERIKMQYQDHFLLGHIDQFTSYFSVISPAYAKENNIKPISDEKYKEFVNLIKDENLTQEIWEREYSKFLINEKHSNNVININNNLLIVVGIGLTPDFLFPMQSIMNIVPAKNKEALVYLDDFGYKKFVNGSIIQFFENYLSFKYPETLKNSTQREKDAYLTKLTTHLTDFDSNLNFQIVKASSPINKEMNLFQIRNNYSENFSSRISQLSSLFLFVLGLIIFTVLFFLIKKYIQKNINIFGNFMSNGIQKLLICLSSAIFAILPVIFAAVCGYFLALILQGFFFGLVSNFWFLPVKLSVFNFGVLFNFLIKTLSSSLLISFLACAWVLRPSINVLLKENSIFSINKFTNKLYKIFAKSKVIWKFRLIVIFNAINQTIILSTAATIVYLIFNFLLHNFGQLERVSEAEINSKKHGFSLEFSSPTSQAGQYHLNNYSNIGKTFSNKAKSKYNIAYLDGANLKKDEAEIDQENEELVASNINSFYHIKDLSVFNNCLKAIMKDNNNDMKKSYKTFSSKYLKLSPSEPFQWHNSKATDHYLLNSYIEEKVNDTNQPETSTPTPTTNSGTEEKKTCESIKDKYEVKETSTKTLFNNESTVFFGSHENEINSNSGTQNQLSSFSPAMNLNKKYNFSSYIPSKNEDLSDNEKLKNNIEKYNSEPLFKSLSEYYQNSKSYKIPLDKFSTELETTSNTQQTETSQKQAPKNWYFSEMEKVSWKKKFESNAIPTSEGIIRKEDFWIYMDDKNQKHYFPTLSRLYKDNGNYWIISFNDIENIETNLNIFKNKIITRFLVDYDIFFTTGGLKKKINIWEFIESNLKQIYPELITTLDNNHYDFISKLINSKYGKYFIERFMKKHTLNITNQSTIINNFSDGSKFDKFATYKVLKDKIDPAFKESIEEGLYYLDSKKIFFSYNEFSNVSENIVKDAKIDKYDLSYHKNLYLMYRPDFLYLFYALMSDNEFLKTTMPIKFAFNYVLYNPNYSDTFKDFHLSGNIDEDKNQKLGLVAEEDNPKFNQNPSGDQTFTYLNGEFILPGNKRISDKILGLKKDSRGSYYRLLKDGHPINKNLFVNVNNDEYPIIINKFSAQKLNLSIGSKIMFQPKNYYDRYYDKLNNNKPKAPVTLKVQDIYDSYFQNAFFISQKNANKILGLNEDYGYNGLLTKEYSENENLPQFEKVISAYSPSGIFNNVHLDKTSPGLKNLFSSPIVKESFINNWSDNTYFKIASNFDMYKTKNGITSNHLEEFIKNFVDTFSEQKFSQSFIIQNASNNQIINNLFFKNISGIIYSISYLFMGIIAPLLILSVIIITHLIVDDLNKLLTTLKLLGFTGIENCMPILIYLSTILISTMLFGTIIFAVGLKIYVNFVFETLSILLPITLSPEYLLMSSGVLTAIFSSIFLKLFFKIKNIYMPVAMKTLSD